MATLRDRDVDALAARLAEPYAKAAAGEHVTGIYKQRFSLASGRFAMIDDGFGFQLVPVAGKAARQSRFRGSEIRR